MGDNKLLSEFVIVCHRRNYAIVKHVSEVDLSMKGIRFARAIEWYSGECVRCFYFCEQEL